MNLILISMGVLGVIAFLAACLLYVVSLYFKVEEDPRIDLVTAVLPGANCGGCGFAGCRNFAEACVKAGNTDGLAFVGRLRAANDGTSANYEIFLKNRTTGKLYKTTKESTPLSSSGSTKLCAVKIPFSKFTEVTP